MHDILAMRLPFLSANSSTVPMQPKHFYLGRPIPSADSGSTTPAWDKNTEFYIEDILLMTPGDPTMYPFQYDSEYGYLQCIHSAMYSEQRSNMDINFPSDSVTFIYNMKRYKRIR